MANYDNSPSRLLQRRRELTLANFRLLNPAAPLQGPAGSNEPADSSIVTDIHKGIAPWVYPLTNGEIVSLPNAIAVALAAGTADTPAPTPPPPPPLSTTMEITITVSALDLNRMPITANLLFNAAQSGQSGQSVTIDWGHGSIDTWDSTKTTPTHTYTTAGNYTLKITGTANAFNGIRNAQYGAIVIVSITSWLDSLTDLSSSCNDQPNNFTVPNYIPSNVTNLSSMFGTVASLNNGFNQPISSWNTAAVTDMSFMFFGAVAFNQDISSWNTAAVTNMGGMFQSAAAFNNSSQPLATNGNKWNTAAVSNMSYMFQNAPAFNQHISSWNTAAVSTMNSMFNGAAAFNNGAVAPSESKPLNSWNTAAVTDMNQMFQDATAFNQDISSWNTAAVTDISYMFNGAAAFNNSSQPLATNGNKWNTATVTIMSAMFQNAVAFNQDISSWNTAAVTNMNNMFNGATAFNNGAVAPSESKPLNSWNTAAVLYMISMFKSATAFNQDISSWNTAAVTNMSSMFQGATAFNRPLTRDGDKWNTSDVVRMVDMFKGATAFNQNISSWLLQARANELIAASIFANGAAMAAEPITKWPPFTAAKGGADPGTNPTYYTS